MITNHTIISLEANSQTGNLPALFVLFNESVDVIGITFLSIKEYTTDARL